MRLALRNFAWQLCTYFLLIFDALLVPFGLPNLAQGMGRGGTWGPTLDGLFRVGLSPPLPPAGWTYWASILTLFWGLARHS